MLVLTDHEGRGSVRGRAVIDRMMDGVSENVGLGMHGEM